MFTGLVEELGAVSRLKVEGAGTRIEVETSVVHEGARLGDSIAINGACLTVIAIRDSLLAFQAGPETLQRTNLGELNNGSPVNLERALRVGDRLGGHMVQGHIDGTGKLRERRKEGEWEVLWFTCPDALASQMVSKGSIAVDGVSLTLVDVTGDAFSVALIPHTLTHTTLGKKKVGETINLETDLLAKYVWKCLRAGEVNRETLQNTGFIRE